MVKSDEKGKWKTISGRHVFIREGQTLSDAMRESGKFQVNNKKKNDEKIIKLEKELKSANGFLARAKINEEIEALKAGYDNIEEYRKFKKEQKQKAIDEKEQKQKDIVERKKQEIEEKRKKLEEEIKEAPKEKRKQYEIIKENNPMLDEYHVGIRSPKDIKTFAEVINDEDSFAWGDFSKIDAEKALKKGEITIYSSYPIKQGTFISTSKIQSEEYAGGGKVYSKTVLLSEVAWINGDEGQYANIK